MKTATCPGCAAPTHAEYAPFCSRGCRDRDLLRWLGEGYRIPGPAPGEGAGGDWPADGLDSGRSRD